MAEGNKFSERKSRLQDFKASIGGGGGQTQQTQQDDGSQQTGKVFDTPRSLDIPRSNRSGGIELPGITTQYDNTLPKTGFIGAIEQGKVQGNVVLPGINDRATRMSEIDPHEAVQGMIQFQKDEDKKLKSQYGLLVKRGVKQIGDTYSKWANANLSKEGILEKLARIGETNGASKKAMQTYIDENEAQTNAYNKKVNDAFSDWEQRNMDMNIMKQYEGETISGLLSRGDGKGAIYKLIKGLSENLTMLPEMVVTMLAPQVGLPLIASDVYIQEAQGTYEEMLENGATYEQAQNGATLVGMLNASVELLLERFLGGVQRAGASFLRRLFLKNAQKEVVRNLTKKGFAEILGRGLLNQTKTSFVEGLEEIVQQLITNAFVKTVNPDRDLGEGLVSSFDQAFWQTFFMPLGGGSDSIIKDYQNNKKVDLQTDIEALNYVMEGEERKAQRMQQAKERMKQRFLNPTMDNGYTPSEEQAEQRANEREENEEFEDELKIENQEGPNYTEEDEQRFTREGIEEQQQVDELRSENNRDTTIENQMMYEALNEGNVNEDLGDPRYQKIDEDLQDIKDSLEKMDDNTFFNRIMSSINKGNKNYVVTTDKNGNKSVLRVVERGGNGKGSNGKTVTVQVMQPSKKSGNVSVSEFTYTPGNLTTDQKQGIITGFENWGKTGNFSDNTAGNERYQLKYEEKGYKPGVAGKNEKSISGKEGVQQRNKINDETIEQLANKYGVRVDVIKGLIKVLKDGKWNGKDYAYGKYLDQVLTLSEQIKESTAPHELLHAIFDMIDPETKAYLISQVMKSEGWSASKAEEWLADSFSNFFRTGKIEGAPKSTWGKIKIFFKRVRSFINGLGRWRSELEEIFTDIITAEGIEDLQGKIDRSEKLNEAKARMKKRFMEYAKNAEKVQKKAESEGKYQKKQKDTPRPLTDIESVRTRDVSLSNSIVINDKNANIIFDNLDKLINLVKNEDPNAEKFTIGLQKSFGLDGNSTYAYKNFRGDWYTLRISNHRASPELAKRNGYKKNNTGITIILEKGKKKDEKFQPSKDVEYLELVYKEKDLKSNKMIGIIKGVKDWIKTGKYSDKGYTASYVSPYNTEEKFQLAGDIESEAFKKRFGDSKVVDENGNPLAVYHGTNQKFSTFGDIKTKPGYRFTADKEYANEHGKNLMKVYLKIENPLYIEDENKVEKILKGAFGKDAEWSDENILSDKFRDEAIKQGYDGIVFEHSGENTYIVFEPNQIKSATDNVGTYDPNNDDIRYQTVYHGSPYEFEKFDSANMGKGEGAQAHGWGHYVAVDESTGRHYAGLQERVTGGVVLKIDGKPYKEVYESLSDFEKDAFDSYKALRVNDYTNDEAWDKVKSDKVNEVDGMIKQNKSGIEYFQNMLKDKPDDAELEEIIKWSKKQLKKYRDEKSQIPKIDELRKRVGTNNNLYEVEIPDPEKADTPTGWNYLEEDGKLSEKEWNELADLANKWGKENGGDKYFTIDGYWGQRSKDRITNGKLFYDKLTGYLHSQEKASKFLESLGYDGIHYFGGRDGEAYVIFNDDDLEITNHEKYQTADDIDPNATSPDQLVEVNDQGLDVMVRFVSEKQKKNALNVNKELLTSDGNPYMWTSTNKYKSKVITDWRNVEDSKYKEFSDKGIQIAWFTNNSEMSYSYADYESKLAPVKKFTSIAELNKFFKENPNNYERALGNGIDDGVLRSSTVYEMKKVDGGYELISNNIESVTKDMEKFYDDINNDRLGGNIGDMPKNKNEALKKLQKYYDDHNYEIEGERTVRLLKDGEVERTIVKEGNTINKFDTKLDALAQGYTIAQEADRYHYKGIIQKVKNPLVVDVKSEGNNPSRWSSLGGAYEFLKKNEKNLDKQINDFKSNIQKIINERNSFYRTDMAKVDKLKDKYRDEYYEAKKNWDGDNTAMDEAKKKITIIREVRELIDDMLYRGGNEYISAISKEQSEFKVDDNTTLGDIYNKAVELNRKYEELHIHFGNVYNIKDYIQKKLPNIAHYINKSPLFVSDLSSLGGLANLDLERLLTDSKMETNDYVFYALNKGGYDGVLFKNIVDYGSTPKEGWKDPKGGDVVATFKSNQFKNWDNEDPTDSKYIRYQTVYHGSPAEFDRFDSTHMGEGEGAQAHGWGHYVAVEKDTGRHYADMGGDPSMGYKGESWNNLLIKGNDPEYYIPRIVIARMDEGMSFAEARNWKKRNIEHDIENIENSVDKKLRTRQLEELKKQLEILNSLKADDFQKVNNRHLYEVEIPDPEKADTPTGWNYLEEDKPLSKNDWDKLINIFDDNLKERFNDYGKSMLSYLGNKGSTLYKFLDRSLGGPKQASKFLESLGYKGIHYYGGRDGEAYVIFNDDDLEITNHEKYQIAEYDYDENGNRKWLKFGEDSEFNPNIFGEPTKKELIEEDKEKEKNNAFYDAWMRYNAQNYEEDQLTMDEFLDGVMKWLDKQQDEYDQKMNDLSQAQNDPKMLELQLRAVKLMEEEGQVGKKFGKNVSKEVRDRQQKEVESKREQLIKDIFDWMYPGLRFEDATYDDQMRADEREAEWEMMGREGIEEKLKYFKKDKNGNWEAKNIKIENPEEKWNKLVKGGNFDEVFNPVDRVLEWKTPQGQKGRLDRAKDPKKYKSVMEKINGGKTKTKVTLKDVTQEVRALEKQKAMEEAEKERKKKERNEAMAKKKQDEYKKMVRMKAFQRLVDMQRFEKYPFLTEDEIKTRYGFTDDEWKTITEQEEIKLPKKWSEKAVSDFNKAVDSQVKALIEGLNWQNNLKRKDAEKNLGEIGDIDIDVLLGRDEEKGQKEVEEFEKLAEEKQPEDKNKKAQELTNKWKTDVQEMFRKAEEKRNERYANKEEKKIDEVKTVEEAKKLTKDNRWKRTKKFWKDTTIQDLIQPISSRIEKISPRIYLELMRFEQRIAIKENTRMKQVEDFVKKMAKIRSNNKKDYLNITLHLLNGNVGTANQMLEKYGTSIPRQVLDEIWADAEDVGYTMNYEGFYYPRKVKDVDDFLNRFAKVEDKNIQGEIDKIIRKKEKQAMERGEEFTPQMKADLINQLLMDGEVEGISLGSGHMKQRKVDTITKDMLEFYEDPVDALLQYITSMTEAVEKARFLGQGKRGDIKSLGEFIADEGITGYDADELKKLLLSRFNYAPMGDMMRGLKVSANIIHLGSPSSALSQLADVSFSLIENGLVNLVQGLTRKYNLDLDALGITNRGEEYKSQGKNETKWEKLQRFTFKMTGFNMMDQFGKKSFVVSTLNKLIKYAKKGDPQLRKDLERRFDDPKMIDEIIEDLKEGRMSENVNLFLFTKLADVQPLTRTQMTNTYLRAGNWRVLYAFKTFGIKQLDYIIQKSRRELQTKPTAKALWSIVTMLGIIMLCGAGDDELKDFSMGRKYSSWIWRMIEGNDWSASQLSDRFWDNFLKLLGFTKYSIYQARTQGIKSAIEDIFFSLPGLDLFTYPMQDIQDAMSEDGLDFSQASSWQLIPIVGKYGYWWAGAGQTKQQKSLGKEKKKSGKSKSSKESKSTGWQPLTR